MDATTTETLSLHTEATEDIDPVTYEVMRHRLWNVNIEHGNTIMRASGSPICVYGHDFNPCILTEEAEYVFYGPYLQFLSSASDSTAKWVVEHRFPEPGIEDGDIYLSNDPWVGATHQMDVTLLCPVFVEGRLFCWVANTLHQTDVGGASPGSFCPDAEDVFQESTPIPPMKIVEAGTLRPDLEEVYLRRSRLPEFLALDLRAGISGNLVAKARILELVDRYGPGLVKGTMRRIISHSESVFAQRLEVLPDGIWRERGYLEQSRRGDRGVHRVCLTLRKEGSRLTFSNEGTDPQAGVLNCTAPGWRGGLVNAVSLAFCYDLLYAIGGPLRHLDFEIEPGTLSSAEFPAAVSNAPAFVIQMTIGMAGNALGRMMVRDPEQRRHIFTSSAASVSPINTMSGVNQWGDPFAMLHLEIVAGGLGAFSYKDGVPTGGLIFDLNGRMPEAEHLEQVAPILYLYRREQVDSGGAGRWARGNGPVAAHVCHGADRIDHLLAASGFAVPTAPGLFGGYPGGPNRVVQRHGTDIREWFERGEIPSDIRELSGTEHLPQPKDTGLVQTPVDVHEFQLSAGAGFGDPLLREPERVAEDVRLRYVSREAAGAIFGVVLDDDGEFAGEATEQRRRQMRVERLGGGTVAPIAEIDGPRVAEYLVEVGDPARIACRMCGEEICGRDGSPKDGLLRRDLPITAAGPLFAEPSIYVDAEVQLRQFCCPSCATLVEVEVALAGDPVLRDTELL
jgi:N-methylhydantoinase B